jgi:hypothetical protein
LNKFENVEANIFLKTKNINFDEQIEGNKKQYFFGIKMEQTQHFLFSAIVIFGSLILALWKINFFIIRPSSFSIFASLDLAFGPRAIFFLIQFLTNFTTF